MVGKRPVMMGWGMLLFLMQGGVVGGAMLAERGISRISEARRRPTRCCCSRYCTSLLLLVSPTLFDRYLVVLMPGAIAIATVAPLRLRWWAGVGRARAVRGLLDRLDA